MDALELSIFDEIPTPSDSEIDFLAKLKNGLLDIAYQYSQPSILEYARSFVPVDDLTQQAESNVLPDSEEGEYEEQLMISLLDWFKTKFEFHWINHPVCESCDHDTTNKLTETGDPTPWEAEGNCYRVELYDCPSCSHRNKFVRYYSVERILSIDPGVRGGRCGEWARVFGAIATSLGFNCRYAWDWTDHVWISYKSIKRGRWVHTDPCENSHDQPLMYERDWDKKLNYIVAFSFEEGVEDVTRSYTEDWEGVLHRRNLVREEWLAETIETINQRLENSTLS